MTDLPSDCYDFFKKISALAFVNPFSIEREMADCALLGIAVGEMAFFERRSRIQALLDRHFRQKPLYPFDINKYHGSDRDIMLLSWLFYVFDQFRAPFVDYIESQIGTGDKVLTLPFAGSLLETFAKAGFDKDDTAQHIGLLFQLHRGFYLIGKAVTGDSPSMVDLRKRLWYNVFTFNSGCYLKHLWQRMEDFSLLLLGATGTGKSTVAKAVGWCGFIPFDSDRRSFVESFTGAFNAINLSQFPAGLLESELFGHQKGSFTGAIGDHRGIFARCSRYGAVFIDEIGEIDIPVQVKLLNVIQNRVFSPVGSHEKLRFEGRVISATNQDMPYLLEKGLFRRDLYYRLCSDVIELPDLRRRLDENAGELTLLIERILAKVISTYDRDLVTSIEARIRRAVPADYPWSGNIRELEQGIRRICLVGSYGDDGKPAWSARGEHDWPALLADRELSAHQVLHAYCGKLYDRHGNYEAVARITKLDRRTVKKYIDGGSHSIEREST
ncbi:MAG: sigma-54-dependent transcriptional regulator [Gammaproteobacteria bacterium]